MSREQTAHNNSQQLALHLIATQLQNLHYELSNETQPLTAVAAGYANNATLTHSLAKDIVRAGKLTNLRKVTLAEKLMKRLSQNVISPLEKIGSKNSKRNKSKAVLLEGINSIIASADKAADALIKEATDALTAQIAEALAYDGFSNISNESELVTDIRTIISLDLSQYGRLSVDTEDALGPKAVFALNQEIQSLINEVVAKLKFGRKPRILNTGDGAIVVLEPKLKAIRFGEEFLKKASERSDTVINKKNGWHFRVGISTGTIAMDANNVAGTVIAKAVRLQSAANTGEVIICLDTWGILAPGTRRNSYKSGQCEIQAKGHEAPISGFRRTIVPPAPWVKNGKSS